MVEKRTRSAPKPTDYGAVVGARIDGALLERLDRRATREGRTRGNLIRRILAEALAAER